MAIICHYSRDGSSPGVRQGPKCSFPKLVPSDGNFSQKEFIKVVSGRPGVLKGHSCEKNEDFFAIVGFILT